MLRHRRTAPRVQNGRVRRKNRWEETPNYFSAPMPSLVIDRHRPGRGYKHIVRKEHVRSFIELLPDWRELSVGLNAIVLDSGDSIGMGWHRPGVVAIRAWDVEIEWEDCEVDFYLEHAAIFEKLAIPVERGWEGGIVVRFTEASARAFLLIHVLVHELGHHHDRMTTRSRRDACRGEGYAEAYARLHEDLIIDRYRRVFAM